MITLADPGGEHYFGLGMNAPGMWDLNQGATLVNNAPTGRSSTYAIAVGGSGNGFQKSGLASFSTVTMGAAIYIPANFLNNTPTPLFRFMDTGTVLVDICVNSVGQLCVVRNGVQLGPSDQFIRLPNGSGWHYVEAKVFFSNTNTGSVFTWVDGINTFNDLGIVTSVSGNWPNQFRFYVGQSGQPTSYWKDLYITEGQFGTNRAQLGDISVLPIYPNGPGVNSAWTPNTGTALAAVQDGINHTGTWPDGDTTYISSSTAGNISDFAHQTLNITGTIYGIMRYQYMRKDDNTLRAVAPITISSGTTFVDFDRTLSNSYNYYSELLETDPHTSAAWTVSGFNNATFGVKETS